jgi:serine/threonine protein kinase
MNSTGSFVAIKEVALNNITKEGTVQLQREINFLKKLNHPNIVKYIG